MNLRKTTRFDYSVFQSTGEKIPKISETEKMDEFRVKELKIRNDVAYTLDVYDLEDLETIDEVNEALNAMAGLSQEFRHVHVELKNLLDDKYPAEYPNAEKYLDSLSDFVKNARKRIRTLKSQIDEENAKSEKKSLMSESKVKLKKEMNSVMAKIEHLNESVDITVIWETKSVDEYIVKMENFVAQFLDTFEEFKTLCGNDFEREDGIFYSNVPSLVNGDIIMAKLLKQKLSVAARNSSNDYLKKKVTLKAQSLLSEIESRLEVFSSKIDVDLSTLSDYQILEFSQNKSVDTEFNEVLSKITDLAALVPDGGTAV